MDFRGRVSFFFNYLMFDIYIRVLLTQISYVSRDCFLKVKNIITIEFKMITSNSNHLSSFVGKVFSFLKISFSFLWVSIWYSN